MKVAASSSLSAIGSTSLPKSEIQPYLRARCPSKRSEKAATRKRIHAIKRAEKVGTKISTKMTGQSRIRTTVMMLGMARLGIIGGLYESASARDKTLRA